jgi:monoamine oxidase
MPVTRRSLLGSMAKLGGAGAVAETLALWDFLKPSPALAASFTLPRDSGRGRSVAILGAGVSGLCAAYELDRAGYDCVILEAQRRAGGRSLTLRRGDVFQEMNQPAQTCTFDEGQYLNAGPGRIPHHHVNVIDYCRRFGVALQPYIFASRANLVHSSTLGNGRTVPVREALYSLQGHVAELLDKCTRKGALDLPVSGEDVAKLQEMLAEFGDLTTMPDKSWSYRNKSGRAGMERSAGVATPAKPISPMKLEEILRSELWKDWLFRDADYYWQTSLLEPVGGMDQFWKGFMRQPLARQSGTIEGLIRYGAKVTAIDLAADKVTIGYDDAGSARTLQADFCVCSIPMPIFAQLKKTNFRADYVRAADNTPTMAAGKVGWQAERFWETEAQIYGGISWTTDTIDQIWYPSFGYLSPKGTLTGAYMRGKTAITFNQKPVAERLAIAREQGERLHPGYAKYVEHGVAIGWDNMEFARGGWVNEDDDHFGANSRILAEPQGRFHMAGDQLTFVSGWQEGAILAAHHAVTGIHQQAQRP